MTDLATLLNALQESPLGQAIRDLGGWGYATINLFHLLGVALLLGSAALLDLRLLGWRRHIPLGHISALATPLAAGGLAVALPTGICLLAANAGDYVDNPFLLIKFVALPLALLNIYFTHRIPAWRTHRHLELEGGTNRALARAGLLSLLLWLLVASAERMIAYG